MRRLLAIAVLAIAASAAGQVNIRLQGFGVSTMRDCSDVTSQAGNLFIGTGAGNCTASPAGGASYLASNNIGIGTSALTAITTGYNNVAVGYLGLAATTTGFHNAAMGWVALRQNTTGRWNTGIGAGSLQANTTGTNNTAIGEGSAWLTTTGSLNTALGQEALFRNTTGQYNTVVGQGAMWTADSSYNTIVGTRAGYLATGWGNTFLGLWTGYNASGSNNVFLGNNAGYYETGSNRLIIDNTNRASEADARAKALIVGTFAAAVADQNLTINGGLTLTALPVYADNTAALAGGLTAGQAYRTAAGALMVTYTP